MANTYEIYGEQETLDKIIAQDPTLTVFEDDRIIEINNGALNAYSPITKLIVPNCTRISSGALVNSTNLQEIWIDSNTVPYVATSSLPENFRTGTGAIYVPANMVESYRADSRWASYKWHVVSKEDYPATNFDPIQDSWTTIATKIANGTDNYSVGDYKTVDLGTEGKIKFQIIAKNVDELADGSGNNAAYTFLAMEALATSKQMNPNTSGADIIEGRGSIGGWAKSAMRTYLSETVFAMLPADLQAVIKSVKKYSCIYDTTGTKVIDDLTNDKLWLPGDKELENNTNYETQGPYYSYISGNNNRIRKVNNNPVNWWTRSADTVRQFRYVYLNGAMYGDSSGSNNRVVFGFCV